VNTANTQAHTFANRTNHRTIHSLQNSVLFANVKAKTKNVPRSQKTKTFKTGGITSGSNLTPQPLALCNSSVVLSTFNLGYESSFLNLSTLSRALERCGAA
jgi:hypothetical protein